MLCVLVDGFITNVEIACVSLLGLPTLLVQHKTLNDVESEPVAKSLCIGVQAAEAINQTSPLILLKSGQDCIL